MDKAAFEIVGNIGRMEIRAIKDGKRVANLSIATSERWKSDAGDWLERTSWHRVSVFAPAKIDRLVAMAQVGTRVRLVGEVRPTSWQDERGTTRYANEFVVGPFGEVELLSRLKPKAEAEPAETAPPPKTAKRA